jgi:hypothetical protein
MICSIDRGVDQRILDFVTSRRERGIDIDTSKQKKIRARFTRCARTTSVRSRHSSASALRPSL